MIGEVGFELEGGNVSFPSLEPGHGPGYFWSPFVDALSWTEMGTKQAYSCGGLRMSPSLPAFRDKLIWSPNPAALLQYSFPFYLNFLLSLLKSAAWSQEAVSESREGLFHS